MPALSVTTAVVFAFFYTEFFDICEIFVFAVDDCDCIIDFEFLDSLCIMYSNSRDLAEAVTISFTLNTYIRRCLSIAVFVITS